MNFARTFLGAVALCSFASCAYVNDWKEARLQKHNEAALREIELIADLHSHSTTPARFDEGIALANKEHLRFSPDYWREIINDSSYPQWQRQKCREQLKSSLTVYDT